ncbi:MAG: hypothetical protein ACXAEE_04510, partial [Candidatus Thorarchaeota archaeon]
MAEGKGKFIPAIIFIIAGVATAIYAVYRIMGMIGGPLASHDLVGPIPGGFTIDLIGIIVFMMPIYIIEFIILSLPFGGIMILMNKLYRAKSY